MVKICRECKQEKNIEQFNKKKQSKDGHDSLCKDCQKQYDIDRRKNPKRVEYCRSYNKKYYQDNSEHLKKYQRNYYQDNKEHYYEYEKERNQKSERIEYTNQYNKKYRQENLEKLRNFDRKRHEQNKLNRNFSTAIYNALKCNKAEQHWETLVPYNLQQLKEHLELQFDENMSWDNYGEYWEIDHIIPQSLFNIKIAKDKDFQICWSLINLRPLEKSVNRSRPKDGRDISKELKDKILGQDIQYDIMNTEK